MKIHCEHVSVQTVVDQSFLLCQLAAPFLEGALLERQVSFVVLPRTQTSITQLTRGAQKDPQPIEFVCIGVSTVAE